MNFSLADDDLDFNTPAAAAAPVPAPAASTSTLAHQTVVISTQQAAADGSYQALVTELGGTQAVEMYMVDRVLEGGESLSVLDSLVSVRSRPGRVWPGRGFISRLAAPPGERSISQSSLAR